jgi:hypothetical protein
MLSVTLSAAVLGMAIMGGGCASQGPQLTPEVVEMAKQAAIQTVRDIEAQRAVVVASGGDVEKHDRQAAPIIELAHRVIAGAERAQANGAGDGATVAAAAAQAIGSAFGPWGVLAGAVLGGPLAWWLRSRQNRVADANWDEASKAVVAAAQPKPAT